MVFGACCRAAKEENESCETDTPALIVSDDKLEKFPPFETMQFGDQALQHERAAVMASAQARAVASQTSQCYAPETAAIQKQRLSMAQSKNLIEPRHEPTSPLSPSPTWGSSPSKGSMEHENSARPQNIPPLRMGEAGALTGQHSTPVKVQIAVEGEWHDCPPDESKQICDGIMAQQSRFAIQLERGTYIIQVTKSGLTQTSVASKRSRRLRLVEYSTDGHTVVQKPASRLKVQVWIGSGWHDSPPDEARQIYEQIQAGQSRFTISSDRGQYLIDLHGALGPTQTNLATRKSRSLRIVEQADDQCRISDATPSTTATSSNASLASASSALATSLSTGLNKEQLQNHRPAVPPLRLPSSSTIKDPSAVPATSSSAPVAPAAPVAAPPVTVVQVKVEDGWRDLPPEDAKLILKSIKAGHSRFNVTLSSGVHMVDLHSKSGPALCNQQTQTLASLRFLDAASQESKKSPPREALSQGPSPDGLSRQGSRGEGLVRQGSKGSVVIPPLRLPGSPAAAAPPATANPAPEKGVSNHLTKAIDGGRIEVFVDGGWHESPSAESTQICGNLRAGLHKFSITSDAGLFVVDFTNPASPLQTHAVTKNSFQLRVLEQDVKDTPSTVAPGSGNSEGGKEQSQPILLSPVPSWPTDSQREGSNQGVQVCKVQVWSDERWRDCDPDDVKQIATQIRAGLTNFTITTARGPYIIDLRGDSPTQTHAQTKRGRAMRILDENNKDVKVKGHESDQAKTSQEGEAKKGHEVEKKEIRPDASPSPVSKGSETSTPPVKGGSQHPAPEREASKTPEKREASKAEVRSPAPETAEKPKEKRKVDNAIEEKERGHDEKPAPTVGGRSPPPPLPAKLQSLNPEGAVIHVNVNGKWKDVDANETKQIRDQIKAGQTKFSLISPEGLFIVDLSTTPPMQTHAVTKQVRYMRVFDPADGPPPEVALPTPDSKQQEGLHNALQRVKTVGINNTNQDAAAATKGGMFSKTSSWIMGRG